MQVVSVKEEAQILGRCKQRKGESVWDKGWEVRLPRGTMGWYNLR